MKILTAFYFTGTGNTRYIVDRLCGKLSAEFRVRTYDVARGGDYAAQMRESDLILLAFPIYGSAPPIPMREFVRAHAKHFAGKRVVIAETQYFFSGDGAASLGRAVERYGGKVVGAEHFNMPNNLCDCKTFPVRNGKELEKTLARADGRADAFAARILRGKAKRKGFRLLPHAVGRYCQRKYFLRSEGEKRKKLKVDAARCVGCGACVGKCPVGNLVLEEQKAVPLGKCVLCYRCVNLCPRKAITLFGKEPPSAQYKGPVLK